MGSDSLQPIQDESLRLAALRAVFPGMQVSIDKGRKIDNSWPKKPQLGERFFPDVLADEEVYRVIGKAANKAEQDASMDLVSGRFSNERQVRLKIFRWPGDNLTGLLAVLQYDFMDVNPAMCCLSIGRLVHLVGNATGWQMRNEHLLETGHHSAVQRIEMLDLTGHNVYELVIESDFGGPGTSGSSLQVFDLSRGRFEELLHTYSWLDYMDEDGYKQSLDIDRTLQTHGQQFCVLKTTRYNKVEWFNPPRVTHPCYKRGEGIDPEGVKLTNESLAPLQ